MPRRCAAYGCNSVLVKGSGIYFFQFPKDPTVRRKWVHYCKRKFEFQEESCGRRMEASAEMRNADISDEPQVWPVGPIIKARAVQQTDDHQLWSIVKTEHNILPDRSSICSTVKRESDALPDKPIIYSVKIDGEDSSGGPQVWHIVKEEDSGDCSDESNGIGLQNELVSPLTGECDADADLTENLLSQSSVVCADTRTGHIPEENEVNHMVKTQNKDNPRSSGLRTTVGLDTNVSISTTKFPICRYSMQSNRTSKRQASSVEEKLRGHLINDMLTGGEMGGSTEVHSKLSAGKKAVEIPQDSGYNDVCVPLVLHSHRYESSVVLRRCGAVDIRATQYPCEGYTKNGMELNDEIQGVVVSGSREVILNRGAGTPPGDDQGQSTALPAGVRKPYRCKLCQKYFSSMDTLRGHYLVHTGARPLTCDVCQKSFNHLSNLRRHKRIHTGVKPYTCSTCGKSFTRLSTLKTHSLTHSEDRPYTCNTCGKSFAEECKLTSHSQTHTGEKPFACITCGKSFAWLSILKKHSLTHTGLKPYFCFICGKRFADPSALKTHGLTHTGERPFTCNICGKGFTTQSNLTSHGVTHR
ncbi:zinc finger protein 233-like isoform X2 [Liolophura sinensis]|uniref:zinc finger protein 233-like isoform X2 n=1 Tax=Liolophura sinensis TaxID=3198878 RepID=UPI003158D688